MNSVVDQIYEAALVPELWPTALTAICGAAGCAGAELLVIEGSGPPRFQATPVGEEPIRALIESGDWQKCERPATLLARGYCGFIRDHDLLSEEQRMRDPVQRALEPYGIGWYTGTFIPMLSGDAATICMQRNLADGYPPDDSVAWMDSVRPHLARAAMIAAMTRLEQARDSVELFSKLAMAAVVFTEHGKILAANKQFHDEGSPFLDLAGNQLAFDSKPAHALFQDIMAQLRGGNPNGRSIPIRAEGESRTPTIVHFLPLVGEARNILTGSSMLAVATPLDIRAFAPSRALLSGLFDLTPSESQLAIHLAKGLSLIDAAEHMGVKFSTSRAYLERVLYKTGTNKQSQLVSLLKTAHLGRADDGGIHAGA